MALLGQYWPKFGLSLAGCWNSWKSRKNLKVGGFETDFKQVPFVFRQTTCTYSESWRPLENVCDPPSPTPTGRGGSQIFSTGLQLSEYVQVVCRNTNGTCFKSVSKTPTFWPNLGQFWPKRAIFEIFTKKWKRNYLSTPETMLRAKN